MANGKMRSRVIAAGTAAYAFASLWIIWSAGPHDPGLTEAAPVPELYGRRLDEVLDELGPPYTVEDFTMAECCTEADGELLNIYPATVPNRAALRIRMMQWHYLRHIVTVWFHESADEWTVAMARSRGRFAPAH